MIHNGASAPLLLEVYFIISRPCWLQPKILSPIHCVKEEKTSWQQESREIIQTLFFCFEWSQTEEDTVHSVAVQGNALITISIFVLHV